MRKLGPGLYGDLHQGQPVRGRDRLRLWEHVTWDPGDSANDGRRPYGTQVLYIRVGAPETWIANAEGSFTRIDLGGTISVASDPTTGNIRGALGTIATDGSSAWIRYGTGSTDWHRIGPRSHLDKQSDVAYGLMGVSNADREEYPLHVLNTRSIDDIDTNTSGASSISKIAFNGGEKAYGLKISADGGNAFTELESNAAAISNVRNKWAMICRVSAASALAADNGVFLGVLVGSIAHHVMVAADKDIDETQWYLARYDASLVHQESVDTGAAVSAGQAVDILLGSDGTNFIAKVGSQPAVEMAAVTDMPAEAATIRFRAEDPSTNPITLHIHDCAWITKRPETI